MRGWQRWLLPAFCWPEQRHEKPTFTARQRRALGRLMAQTPSVVVPAPQTADWHAIDRAAETYGDGWPV